jgi:hypothetical protein
MRRIVGLSIESEMVETIFRYGHDIGICLRVKFKGGKKKRMKSNGMTKNDLDLLGTIL